VDIQCAHSKSALGPVRTSGLFVTTTPRLVAAATSMLLKPTATLETTLRAGQDSRTDASMVSVMRHTRPSRSLTLAISSVFDRGLSPACRSTSARFLARAMTSSGRAREIMTRGFDGMAGMRKPPCKLLKWLELLLLDLTSLV